MGDLKHTCGSLYNLWFTWKKGQCESEQHQTKKINIVFGLDQSKWPSGLSWCEYTLNVRVSQARKTSTLNWDNVKLFVCGKD